MELRICGTEQELASFIMYLGKVDSIKPTVKTEIKSDVPKIVSKMDTITKKLPKKGSGKMITTAEVAKKYGVTGQTIRNYAKAGMPYSETDKKKMVFDLDEVDKWITEYQSKHTMARNRGKKYITRRSKPVKVDPTEYALWCRDISDMCRVKGVEKGVALSTTYKLMTKRYGIVWDQLKKDYYKDNQMSAKSTLELAYYLEKKNSACKNLLIGVLSNVLEGKE